MGIIWVFLIFGLIRAVLLTTLISEAICTVYNTFIHNSNFKYAVLYEDIIQIFIQTASPKREIELQRACRSTLSQRRLTQD